MQPMLTQMRKHWDRQLLNHKFTLAQVQIKTCKKVCDEDPPWLFKNIFIYLFWLCQVLVVACGIFAAAWGIFSGSMRTLSCCIQTLSRGIHIGSSSPTRNRTWAPCIGSVESYPLDYQGSPHHDFRFFCLLNFILFIFLYSRFLLVIYFIHIGVYMSIPTSQFIPPAPPAPAFPPWCPYVCSLHLCLYFCLANWFICTHHDFLTNLFILHWLAQGVAYINRHNFKSWWIKKWIK